MRFKFTNDVMDGVGHTVDSKKLKSYGFSIQNQVKNKCDLPFDDPNHFSVDPSGSLDIGIRSNCCDILVQNRKTTITANN